MAQSHDLHNETHRVHHPPRYFTTTCDQNRHSYFCQKIGNGRVNHRQGRAWGKYKVHKRSNKVKINIWKQIKSRINSDKAYKPHQINNLTKK